MNRARPCFAVTIVAACSVVCVSARTNAEQKEFSGVVEQVVNGEIIYVRDSEGTLHRVLINWIAAPTAGQARAAESRESLRQDVLGKTVRVFPYREEPTLPSDVYLGDVFLSNKRLQDGWAWHYKQFSGDKKLAAAEATAKAAKRGIWQDDRPQAPWDYRKKLEATALTWSAFLSDCGLKAQEVNQAKTEKLFREKYQGQVVAWLGVVDSISERPIGSGYLISVRMEPTESILGSSDLTLAAGEDWQDLVTSLKKDDKVRFSGRLTDQGGRVLNHRLELLELEILP